MLVEEFHQFKDKFKTHTKNAVQFTLFWHKFCLFHGRQVVANNEFTKKTQQPPGINEEAKLVA